MKVEINKCSCSHEFQDKTHGKQMRVMNPIGKGEKGTSVGTHRCTVCGKVHKVGK